VTATTAVSADELARMVDEPAECELWTLDLKDHLCTKQCKLRAVARWKTTCPAHGTEVVWVCERHDLLIQEGEYDRCNGRPVLWLPA
jgi:hypothetical protein